MRIVFMGTPEAAVPTLRRCLNDGHEVVAVWTQPNKPAGRRQEIATPPVKEFALARGLNVYQPARIKDEEAKALFASHAADVAVVVAYGRILPTEYLRTPLRGCINVHFSLLPLYRGAAPVNWAVVNGEKTTGVTTMLIEPELDSGPILLQHETDVGQKENAPQLMARLSEMGADLLSETIAKLDLITPRPQDDRAATFAPMLGKNDGLIKWSNSAQEIERRIRGLQPWPNAFTHLSSRRLIIWSAETFPSQRSEAVEGEIVIAHGDDLVVRCGGQTSLRLIEIQPEGSRRMNVRDFINGARINTGERLE